MIIRRGISLVALWILPQMIFAQPLLEVREQFHSSTDESNLRHILDNYEGKIAMNPVLEGYFGTCEAMLAEHVFFPVTKYNYFKRGTKRLEKTIRQQKTIENVYLRLIIQLNTPGFLNYDQNIQQDLDYFTTHFHGALIDQKWKIKFLNTILHFKNNRYDFTRLEQLKKAAEG